MKAKYSQSMEWIGAKRSKPTFRENQILKKGLRTKSVYSGELEHTSSSTTSYTKQESVALSFGA